MQKLSLLPLALITSIGALWAATLIFPNTTEFPRSPGGAGTISGALALFGVDGTAISTQKLNGVPASGYLQNRDCRSELVNKVWVGIETDGRAKCGSRTVQLADIGRFSEVSAGVLILKGGIAPGVVADTTYTLKEGDIIQTTTGTGTIRFVADESILRLDTATTVELSVGTLGGNSVAQAILADGRLWGRILTSTGVNLGGGGLVAGVRGTSVSVERKIPTDPYTISVIDSVIPLDAATLSALPGMDIGNLPLTLSGGSQIVVSRSAADGASGLVSVSALLTPSTTKNSLLTSSAWIRNNTRADLVYLDWLSLTSQRAVDEVVVTDPDRLTISDPLYLPTKRALCNNTTIWYTQSNECMYAYADYTSSDKRLLTKDAELIPIGEISSSINTNIYDDGNLRRGEHIGGSLQKTSLAEFRSNQGWSNMCPNSNGREFCKFINIRIDEGWTDIIVDVTSANETSSEGGGHNGNIDHWNQWNYLTLTLIKGTNYTTTPDGLLVSSPGQYLSYPIDGLSLAGKTITIDLGGNIMSTGKKYVFDLGNWKAYVNNGTPKIQKPGGNTDGSFTCNTNKTSCTLVVGSTPPTQMIIGNNSQGTPNMQNPIGTTIKNIRIQ